MIFTVIIALEFKRTLLLVTEQTESVLQVRAVILIALLAIVRKLIILDISPSDAPQLLALAVATLSLGGVYWLIRDQDIRERQRAFCERSTNRANRAQARCKTAGGIRSPSSSGADEGQP